MAVASEAFFIANSFGNGHTQSNTYVFNRVVIIYLGIAGSLNIQIHEAMAGNLIQHMV